jgi:RNA polymerase sigma factor (sigma-70 family)
MRRRNVTVDRGDWLTEQFEASRPRLRAVAFRMLGSQAEAEDAVQETWLRVDRANPAAIENLAGWLTTVIGRVCLDGLRSRRTRREDPVGTRPPESNGETAEDPAHEALVTESIGSALLVVLDLLPPAERVAFVLHDVFAVPFDEIADIVDRSPDAARQLASRARRRVQGTARAPEVDLVRQREVVDAFLVAARGGDFDGLLTLLDPDVVLRPDATAIRMGSLHATRGAAAVAGAFSGGAGAARRALVDGVAGLAWTPGGHTRGVVTFTITNGMISAIDLIGDRDRLGQLDIVVIED